MVEALFSRPGQEAHLISLGVPKSLVKETAPLGRLRAGDYRVVAKAQEGVARSDGGEVSEDMRGLVERVGYEVTEGQVLALHSVLV